MRAYLLEEPDGIRVISPYNREFVDSLKAEIPRWARDFDMDSRTWLVDREYEDTLVSVVRRYYSFDRLVTITEADNRANRAAARERASRPAPAAHSTQQCLDHVRRIYREEAEVGVFPPAASEAIVRACYRARALQLHPDLAGSASHDAMVALNRAYETLLKSVKRASA